MNCLTDEGTTRLYLDCDGVKVPLVTDVSHNDVTTVRVLKLMGKRCPQCVFEMMPW